VKDLKKRSRGEEKGFLGDVLLEQKIRDRGRMGLTIRGARGMTGGGRDLIKKGKGGLARI